MAGTDDQELLVLRALRSAPDSSLRELADAVGLPRTNFGRPLSRRLREPVGRLVAERLVEEHGGRYRLSELGRRTLAERALDGVPLRASSRSEGDADNFLPARSD